MDNVANLRGLVIAYFGTSVAVEDDHAQIFQCHLRKNQALPVVGDQVTFTREGNETGVITGILPRRSLLSRGVKHGEMKPLAANLDLLVIVMAPPPVLSEYLIDRYLIAAELLKIKPVLVLNKMDLLNEAARESVELRLQAYRHIPYDVCLSSAIAPDGMVAVSALLKDKTAVLVGPSGVGKSSMIAALCENEMIEVREVTQKGIGKHTTTATRLYHLPSGGQLIDSPGVREFNLWPIAKPSVLDGFKEFQTYVGECKFRDCSHLVEPGCAVQAAVAAGQISPLRYASYQKLMNK